MTTAPAAHKVQLNPIEVTTTGSYSPGVRVEDLVFVSGQGPVDPATKALRGDTIEQQTRYTLENVQDILAAGHCRLNDCVKLTVYLADLEQKQAFDAAYRDFFAEPRPARTVVGATLAPGQHLVIDAIAVRGGAT